MPVRLTGHPPSVLGQGWYANHNLSPKAGNNSEVGVYSACMAARSACLRPVLLVTGPIAERCAEGTPERAGDMARWSPLQRLNVLGCALAAIVFAGFGCSVTSAPSRANSSAPMPLATANSP